MIVMKFGGTSLGDAERILAVAAIVQERGDRRPLVVVSALGRVTDLLERAIACALADDLPALEPVLADLDRCHRWALAGCVEDAGLRHDLSLEVDRLFDDLRQRIRSIRILREGTPRAADAILAFGETLSARIVTAAFRDRGLDARCVDPRSVVRTDDAFGAAEPDLERTRAACRSEIEPLLVDGVVPVVGGFVGSAPDGATTTLGRGGSDTSAAVLGLMLDAEEIQIWTDVDGLMSADPRLVPTARTLARISFAEAAELAFYGARVLHPDSIAPAVQRSIPVRVLNSMRPDGAGTLVVDEVEQADQAPVAVASRPGIRLVRAFTRRMRAAPGFAGRVLEVCGRQGIAPELVLASEVSVSLATSSQVDAARLAKDLSGEATVECVEERAVACVVGAALSRDHELRSRVVAELARWEPDLVVTGTSRASVAAVVKRDTLEEALRRLHERFFEASAA